MQKHSGNVVELVDYALSRLRAGKAPGKIKKEIHTANAGWAPVEINRALAAAIIQLQAEHKEQEAKPVETVPALIPAVEVPAGTENGEVDIEKKLAEITAQNELENQTSQANQLSLSLLHGKESQYPVAFPGEALVFEAAKNWGVLTALVLALVMLAAIAILVFNL